MNAPAPLKRFGAAIALEARIALRYRIVLLAAALAALWTASLTALPPSAAREVAPFVLFLDTAGFGALIAVALVLFERVEGAEGARAAAPVHPAEAVAARVGVLTVLACAMALPLTAVAVPATSAGAHLASATLVCAGVALASVLLVAVCLAAGARANTLLGGAVAAVPWIVPLIALPALHLAGAVSGGLVFAVPTTGAAELIRTGTAGQQLASSTALAGAWALLCAAASCAWAAYRAVPAEQTRTRLAVSAPRHSGTTRRPAPARSAGGGAVAAFARFDLLGAARDPLLVAIAVGPLLLALLVRLLYPAVAAFAESSWGLDPDSAAPAVFAAVVLLHVPVMSGAAVALRVVDDADEHTLIVLLVSPLPAGAYLGLRAAGAAVLALLGLAASVPLSGLAPDPWPGPQAVAAVLLAAAQAPLIVVTTAALAGNKVEALAVLKAVGAVSVLLPAAAWALPETWTWALLPLPPAWPLLAVPGYPGEAAAWLVLLCGIAATAAAGALAALRVHTSWRR